MKLYGFTSGVVGVACAIVLFSTAQSATIQVDAANCPGPGDGSELDPYCSIQTAIDSRQGCSGRLAGAPRTLTSEERTET